MFFKKSVDDVLATFRKAVEDLRKINEEKHAEIARIQLMVANLQAEKTAAVVEADRANKIADNISKLISA